MSNQSGLLHCIQGCPGRSYGIKEEEYDEKEEWEKANERKEKEKEEQGDEEGGLKEEQNVNNYTFLVLKLRNSSSIGLKRFGLVVAWNFVELCLEPFFFHLNLYVLHRSSIPPPSTMLVSAHYSLSITTKGFSNFRI